MIHSGKVRSEHNEIISVLDSFETVPLYKMSKNSLMNRTDTKYLLSIKVLPELLRELAGSYKVMEIFQEKAFPYRTTYFDTDDFLFYNQHMTGKLERHKIRYRKYESSGASYLEIKKKTNKKRTEKVRIVHTINPNGFDSRASYFIASNSPYDPDFLKPRLANTFTRTTLLNSDTNERITFDFDLTFLALNGKKVELPFISVAELKQDGFSNQSAFVSVAKRFSIRPIGFSKYCFGSYYVGDMTRTNLLKPKLLLINKIRNDYFKPAAT